MKVEKLAGLIYALGLRPHLSQKFKKGFNASLHKQNALKIVQKYPKIVG